MPSIQKTLLGGFVGDPTNVAVPKSSKDNKTIAKSHASILLFKDTTQEHSEYLQQVLPRVFLKNWTTEGYVKWFRDLPSGSYIELDLAKKMCFLCSLSP
jgi:hypothetical protein